MTDQNTFTGNLGADPEIRYTQNGGDPVANFRIGNTQRRLNRQTSQWEDGATLWLRIEAWGQLAENVAASLKKGVSVAVEGNLVEDKYTDKQGQERTNMKVKATDVRISLRNQRAQGIERATSNRGGSNGGGGGRSNGGYDAPANSPAQDDDTPF